MSTLLLFAKLVTRSTVLHNDGMIRHLRREKTLPRSLVAFHHCNYGPLLNRDLVSRWKTLLYSLRNRSVDKTTRRELKTHKSNSPSVHEALSRPLFFLLSVTLVDDKASRSLSPGLLISPIILPFYIGTIISLH